MTGYDIIVTVSLVKTALHGHSSVHIGGYRTKIYFVFIVNGILRFTISFNCLIYTLVSRVSAKISILFHEWRVKDMDNIAEQLVAKQRSTGDLLKMIGIGLGAVLLASLMMFLAMTIAFSFVIPAVLVLFGGVWLIGNQNVEYEYIVTNDQMDIDKIIGKRKRKRMITLDLGNAEDFTSYKDDTGAADVTVHASSGLEQDACCLLVNHSGYGKVKLIFNPNEKMREAIMQELPSALRVKMKQYGK